ncbi:WbqC family protein [Plantactinospora sp. CA-290183]|uniref:WbqC family protein n=1 Tax=Plantactinospora sp. CA-290183 TaxID=3240006 RepID=UPI003D8CFDBC
MMRPAILVAHQPAYLPWSGYFARLLDVDRLVLLDHVQFAERGRQHRNVILAPTGGKLRLTVPVRRRFGQPINAVHIADQPWAVKHWRAIEQAYRTAPFWSMFGPPLTSIYERPWALLVDLNIALTRFVLDALGLPVTLLRSSGIRPEGAKTEMLVDLCRRLDANTLRIGMGGSRNYLCPDVITQAGVTVECAAYTHPPYPQRRGPFTPDLAAIDLLLWCGPDGARQVLRDGSYVHPWIPGDSR